MNIETLKFAAHIVVLGDIMLDKYYHGDTDRISPESPVPVVNINTIDERPGGAANVALNLASLGVKVTLLGFVGKDEAAQSLIKLLQAAGVDLQLVELDSPTITKLRVISRNQQLIRLDFEKKFHNAAHDLILSKLQLLLKNAAAFILSDYAKGTLQAASQYIACAKSNHVPVFVDPKSTSLEGYKDSELITPNKKEFEKIVGEVCSTNEQICMHANLLRAKFNIKAILVTMGGAGMLLISDQHQKGLHITTIAKEVYDVTGAGDTVIAMMALAHTENLKMQEALNLATAAAAVVVGKIGTASVLKHELIAQLAEHGTEYGVYDESHLLSIVHNLKHLGKRIVMTNGCFDILHLGHIQYLREAKSLGDVLIIAVNTDESVKKLKGKHRPINDCNMRMAILAELNCVDFVVPFAEDTPYNLITNILPDILVKGGDYTVEQIAGAKEVLNNGGQVEIIPIVEGYSTTSIVEKVKNDKLKRIV